MSWLDSIKKALGGDEPGNAPPAPPPPPPTPPFGDPPAPPPSGGSHAALDAFWSSVGALESDVIANAISPQFTGGPRWPTPRQAYRVVRRGETILIATDGLSDPADGEPDGFGCELFIETADLAPELRGEPGDVMSPARSWAFEVLRYIAATVADAGGINCQLDRYGVISTEAPGANTVEAMRAQVPPRFFDENGSLGILIGGPPADFAAAVPNPPNGPIRIVPVVLITAAEMERIRHGGAAARDQLVADLAASPTGWRSSLTRPEFA